MKKVSFILLALFVALLAVSCDLLFNRDSDSTPPSNDVAISSLDASSSVTQGESVNIDVKIKNSGTRDVKEEILITLTDQTEDTVIGTRTLESGLALSDSATISYSWDTGNFSIGEHNIVARHNIKDDNADNDSLMSTLSINKPDITDISVSEITVPSMATQGDEINVSVTVQNVGSSDASQDFVVSLSDQTDDNEIVSQTVNGGLDSGNKAVLSFTWNTSEASVGDHTLVASHNFDDDNSDNDSRTSQVTIEKAQVTDIAVTEVSGPSSVDRGEEAEVSVTIANQGNQDVNETFSITLIDETDGTKIEVRSVSGLDEGDSTTLNFDWDTDGASVGDHTLVASHDLNDNNSDNDSGSTTIRVSFLDLQIESVSAPSSANQGDEVTVSVQLRNRGNQDIDDNIDVSLTDDTDGTVIGAQTINGGLDAGGSTTLTFTWGTAGASIGDHTLVASHDLDDDNGNNDSGSATVEIYFLDLATEISAPSNGSVGDDIDVEVTIENRGNWDIDDDITVTLTDETSGEEIGTMTINDGLNEGESETLTFTWDTDGISIGRYTLVASHDFEDNDPDNDSDSTSIFIFF